MRRCTFLFLGNACLGSLLLIAGCSDEPLVPPEADMPGDPALSFEPYTGLDCEAPCLREEVTSGWTYTTNPPSGTYIVVTESSTPTAAGSSLSVTWCKYRISDDYLYGCLTPNGWWAGSYRSGKVLMLAQHNGFERVRFESTIPTPELEAVEFERPEPASCSGSWCGGPFRLKVELLKSGWHHDDKILISVENTAGSRWPIEDSSPTVSGNTYEWTWSSMFWPGAGSKLVVTYWPWNVLQDVKQEFILPLADPSASLTLEASDSMVAAGTPVTFTPKSPTATVLEVLSWDWQADGAEPPATVACAPGTNPCTTAVHESGTMHVEARVDGQVRNASVAIAVSLPELIVECDGSVQRGGQVRCTAEVVPAQEFTFVEWSAYGLGFFVRDALNVSRPSGHVEVWEGHAAASSEVVAQAQIDVSGVGTMLTGLGGFSVTPRSWPTPQYTEAPIPQYIVVTRRMPVYPSGDSITLGLFDGRMPRFETLLIDSVSAGPNEGLMYFEEAMTLERPMVAVHPALNDPTHSWYMDQDGLGSGTCMSADVSQLRANVERHEGVTLASNSHPGVANEQFLIHEPQDLIETLYTNRGAAKLVKAARETWRDFVNGGPYRAAQDDFDRADYPLVFNVGCVFDWNPNDA